MIWRAARPVRLHRVGKHPQHGPTVSNGWKLTFTLPTNVIVDAVWNGTMTRTGDQATIVNFPFTGTIYPGYSLSIGFSGTSTGTFVPPSGFVLNGSPCPVTINH